MEQSLSGQRRSFWTGFISFLLFWEIYLFAFVRLYLMKEMYNNYEEEEDDWDLPEDKDPFQEDVDTEVNIGTVQVTSE